jgi:hypothetical protein
VSADFKVTHYHVAGTVGRWTAMPPATTDTGLTDCSPRRTSYGVSVGAMGSSLGFEEDLSVAKDFFGAAPGAENSVFSAMSNLLFLGAPGRIRSDIVSGVGLVRPPRPLIPVRPEII